MQRRNCSFFTTDYRSYRIVSSLHHERRKVLGALRPTTFISGFALFELRMLGRLTAADVLFAAFGLF